MTMASPRIAAQNSFDSQPSSFENTVFQYSFFGILTACRRIPTGGRKKRRNHILIYHYRENDDFAQNCLQSRNISEIKKYGRVKFLKFKLSTVPIEKILQIQSSNFLHFPWNY